MNLYHITGEIVDEGRITRAMDRVKGDRIYWSPTLGAWVPNATPDDGYGGEQLAKMSLASLNGKFPEEGSWVQNRSTERVYHKYAGFRP